LDFATLLSRLGACQARSEEGGDSGQAAVGVDGWSLD
jgi:hypothetical protein